MVGKTAAREKNLRHKYLLSNLLHIFDEAISEARLFKKITGEQNEIVVFLDIDSGEFYTLPRLAVSPDPDQNATRLEIATVPFWSFADYGVVKDENIDEVKLWKENNIYSLTDMLRSAEIAIKKRKTAPKAEGLF